MRTSEIRKQVKMGTYQAPLTQTEVDAINKNATASYMRNAARARDIEREKIEAEVNNKLAPYNAALLELQPEFEKQWENKPTYIVPSGAQADTTMAANMQQWLSDRKIDDKNPDHYKVNDRWSLEQKAYLVKLFEEDPKKAYEFAADVNTAIENDQIYELGKKYPIMGGIVSLGTNVGNVIEAPLNYAEYGFEKLSGNEDAKLRRIASADITNNLRSGGANGWVSFNIGDYNVGGFIYNGFLSFLDSAIAGLSGSGVSSAISSKLSTKFPKLLRSLVTNLAGGAQLGLSAAASASNDILDRGGTSEQAIATGAVSWLFESLGEALSLGEMKWFSDSGKATLKSILNGEGKNWLKKFVNGFVDVFGKPMLVNAGEETLTEAANITYDTLVNADISQYAKDIEAYMAQGMSEEEARQKAKDNIWAQVGEAAASGAFIGLLSGGGNAAKLAKVNNQMKVTEKAKQKVSDVVTPKLAEMKITSETKPIISAAAKAVGVNVVYKNLDTTKDGKKFTPEGYYDKDTKTLYVNSKNHKNFRPMEFVFKHEFTHALEADTEGYALLENDILNSEAFKEFLNTRTDAAGNVFESREAWASDIIKRYTEAGIEIKGDKQLYAMHEQVADFVGGVLFGGDSAITENFLNGLTEQTRKSFIDKVRDFFAKIKKYFIGRKEYSEIQMLENRFIEVAKKVGEINRNTPEGTSTGENIVYSDKKYSFSSIANTFFGDENMTVEDFKSGNYKNTEGYKQYVDRCVENLSQSTEDFNEDAARESVEMQIDGIVSVAIATKEAGYDILDDAKQRDIKDSKKRLLFSSLEPNSDYFTSSDISTICDKRKNFAEIYDEIVRREEKLNVPKDKRFFNNIDNYFIIHQIMASKGLTQPCKQCYVESMRKNLAPMAEAFLELIGETDTNNKNNKQLYNDKGELKKNNSKLREKVLALLKNEGKSANYLNAEKLTTAEGLAELKLRDPLIYEAFNSFYGQSKPKMPKEATPFRFGELTALLTDSKGKIKKNLVKKINHTGGFRLQSYSDFQIENFVDVLQVLFEAGTLGLNGHAYTKVPAFLEATKNTNLKRNISVFMYQDGNEWKIDKNDSLPMPLEEIYKLVESDKEGNTGIIAVSQNKHMSAWIMANGHIGYGIPFHKSGIKMDTVRDTDVKTDDGRVIKGYSEIIDHTRYQTEVYAATETKVRNGIDIYGWWDFSNTDNLSQKGLIEKNLKRYIDECEKKGYLPKFRNYVMDNAEMLNEILEWSKRLGFSSADAKVDDIAFEYKGYTIPYGYYKFLGDFGMFTPDGEAAPQKTLSLENYDFAGAIEFFKDTEKLRRNEVLQQFANGEERETLRNSNKTTAELEAEVAKRRGKVVDEVINRNAFYSPLESKPMKMDNYAFSIPPSQIEDILTRVQNGTLSVEDAQKEMQNKETLNDIASLTEEDASFTPETKAPTREGEGDSESKFYSSLLNSDLVSEEVKKEIENDTYIKNYGSTTNKETLKTAYDELVKGGAARAQQFFDLEKNPDRASFVDAAVGFILLENYQRNGDTEGALKVAEVLDKIGTQGGRLVQIYSILGRLTPEGMAQYAQRTLDKALEDMAESKSEEWLEKNSHKFELTQEEKDKIIRGMRLAVALDDGTRAKAIIMGEILGLIQDKIPPSAADSIRALQRISMLFNVKTNVRNILGNAGMVPMFHSSDFFGAMVDKSLSKTTNVRTKGAAIDGKSERAAFKKGGYETLDDFKRHIHTKQEELTRFNTRNAGKAFNENTELAAWNKIAKVLNGFDNATSLLLELGDRPFYEMWFIKSLNNQLRLNNTTTPTVAMLEIAKKEALQRTWQDKNAVTRSVSEMKRVLNRINLGGYGLGDVIMKFTTTPANLAKAMYEFSPLGFINAGKQLSQFKESAKKGNTTVQQQHKVATGFGNAITGSIMYLLVTALAILGAIDLHGGGDDDKDASNFEKYVVGIPSYSMKVFGHDVSYSWMQPMGAVLATVADLMEGRKDESNGFIDDAVSALKAGGTVFVEQSFLKNLYDFFQSEGLVEGLASVIINEPAAFMPQIVSQAASFTDPYQRVTYDNSNPFMSAFNKALVKLPFVRKSLPKRNNVLGEDVENIQYLDPWRAFASPYNENSKSNNEVAEKVYDLYKATDDATVIPRVAPYSFKVKGFTKSLSPDVRYKFQADMGEMSARILESMFASESFKKLSPELQTKAISKAYSYATAYAKSQVDYSYEEIAAMAGGTDILTEAKYEKLSPQAIKILVDDYFFSKKERACKSDAEKLASLFTNSVK